MAGFGNGPLGHTLLLHFLDRLLQRFLGDLYISSGGIGVDISVLIQYYPKYWYHRQLTGVRVSSSRSRLLPFRQINLNFNLRRGHAFRPFQGQAHGGDTLSTQTL